LHLGNVLLACGSFAGILALADCASLEGLSPPPDASAAGDKGDAESDASMGTDAADTSSRDAGGEGSATQPANEAGPDGTSDAGPSNCVPSGPAAGLATAYIVFDSNRDEALYKNLYIVQADGCGLRRLTNHSANDMGGSIAPDGQRIAYLSDIDGSLQIYVQDLTSGAAKKITNVTGLPPSPPAWSPDGMQIAFSIGNGEIGTASEAYGVYVVPADGSVPPRLVGTSCPGFGNPVFSPSYSSVTGRIYATDLGEVCSFDPKGDGGAAQTLLDSSCADTEGLAVSPDGKNMVVAYAPAFSGQTISLGVVATSGGCNIMQVTQQLDGAMSQPTFGPNSLLAAVSSNGIVVVRIAKDGVYPIPHPSGSVDGHPSFAPATFH
jgi:Tol biopolymer transport system component